MESPNPTSAEVDKELDEEKEILRDALQKIGRISGVHNMDYLPDVAWEEVNGIVWRALEQADMVAGPKDLDLGQ